MTKTAKLITLGDAIRKRIVKPGDWVNPYGLYSMYSGKILTIIPGEKTGTNLEQSFARESLKCFYSEDSSGIDTLWFDTTRSGLLLKGEIGYLHGVSSIEEICKLFSDLSMGLVAKATTEDDIDYLRSKETWHNLNKFNSFAWLGTDFVSKSTKICYGIKYFDPEGITVGNYKLVDSEGVRSSINFGVRPAVSIWCPNKIFVDMESMKREGAWKLLKK